MKKHVWQLSVVVILSIVSTAAATSIVRPTGATAVALTVGNPAQYQSIARTIDNSGLSSNLNTNDAVPAFGSWPTHDVAQTDLWVANASGVQSGVTGYAITYDLGTLYSLDGFHLWNENELGGTSLRSSKNYSLEYSTDNSNFFAIGSTPSTFTQATGSASYQGEDYSLASIVIAQYFKLTVTNSYSNDYMGLSEIRFISLPEPSSLALLAFGGAFMWFVRRRRGR